MKKEIRLLIEGFFDDELFNVNDDINQDITDIGDQYYDYHIGDIYYKNKNPYAVCCGEAKDFSNTDYARFMLIDFKLHNCQWSQKNNYIPNICDFSELVNEIEDNVDWEENEPTGEPLYDGFKIINYNDFIEIDEDGYENTQTIRKFVKETCTPFSYCKMYYGDNAYIPSIDELQILSINSKKLNTQFNIFKSIYNHTFWSSSQFNLYNSYAITIYNKETYNDRISYVIPEMKNRWHLFIPFYKIN